MSTLTYLTSLVQQAISRLNNYEANAKKVDELPHQTTLEPTSKIPVSRAGNSEHVTVQQIISSIQNSNYNQLLAVGNITVDGSNIIVPSGVSGQINGSLYGTSTEITIPIALCDAGFNRKDILVLTTSNTIIAISGEETDGAIVLAPPTPTDTVYITEFDVNDTSIGAPIDPIIGTSFKKKSESLGYGDPSLTGSNAVIQLRPEGNSRYALGNAGLISIDGFGLSLITGNPSAEVPYDGKDLFIENTGTTPFTLKHDGSGSANIKFFFIDETDLIVPAGGKVWLKYGNPYCEVIFKSWSEVDLSNKADKPTYVINNNVSGTHPIDFNVDTHRLTLIGNTTFTEINLPASGFSKTITLHVSGNFGVVFPASWTQYISGEYDGTATINTIVVEAFGSFRKVQISQPD